MQKGELDQQFAKLSAQLALLAVSQPRAAKLRVQAWLTKLKEPTNNAVWKRNRNLYGALLLAQLQQGQLQAPFAGIPPDGALPNLPNHLIYRAMSPSRVAAPSRSRSISPVDGAARARSPAVAAQQPLNKGQVHNLVKTFHTNMQARGFDVSQPRPQSKGRSRPVAATAKPQGPAGLVPGSLQGSGGGSHSSASTDPYPGKAGHSHGREDRVAGGSRKAAAGSLNVPHPHGPEPSGARDPYDAADDTHADQGPAAAVLMAAKEAEIAARVAAKRRQQLERQLQADREAALQAQQRRHSAKAQLDAVISRYSEAREQWASPGSASGGRGVGAGSAGAAGGGGGATAAATGWRSVPASPSHARTRQLPVSPGALKLLLRPQDSPAPATAPRGLATRAASTGRGSARSSTHGHEHDPFHPWGGPSLRLGPSRKAGLPTRRVHAQRWADTPPRPRSASRSPSPAPRRVIASGVRASDTERQGAASIKLLPLPYGEASPLAMQTSPRHLGLRPMGATLRGRSRSRSPSRSPQRVWASPNPALTYSVARRMRSSAQALHAAAEAAAAQAAGPAAYDPSGAGVGDGGGLLLPRLLAAPPMRPASLPARFEFAELIAPLLPSASVDLQEAADTGAPDVLGHVAAKAGRAGGEYGYTNEEFGSAGSSPRNHTPFAAWGARGAAGASTVDGGSGSSVDGARDDLGPPHCPHAPGPLAPMALKLVTPPDSPREAAERGAAAQRAGLWRPPAMRGSLVIAPPPAAMEHALGGSSGTHVPRLRAVSQDHLQHPPQVLGPSTSAEHSTEPRAPRPPSLLVSPRESEVSVAAMPSSVELTEAAKRSLAATLASWGRGTAGAAAGSGVAQGGSRRGSQRLRHGSGGGGGHSSASGSTEGGEVDLSGVASGLTPQQGFQIQETPKLLRRSGAGERYHHQERLGRSRSRLEPASVDALLAGLPSSYAGSGQAPLDAAVDKLISDFEGSLLDNFDITLRTSPRQELATPGSGSYWDALGRSPGGTGSGLSPTAMRLADRFALHSALGEFRRAVDRLKRRLALLSTDPSVAEALYGRAGENPAPASARDRHSSVPGRGGRLGRSSVMPPPLPPAWRPGGAGRSSAVSVERGLTSVTSQTGSGAAGGSAGDDPERFYRIASEAVARYVEDVELLLTRVRSVLQRHSSSTGGASRSGAQNRLVAPPLPATQAAEAADMEPDADQDVAAMARELEARRGLIAEVLQALEESAHQLGLRLVTTAAAPIALPGPSLLQLSAALREHLRTGGARAGGPHVAVSERSAQQHQSDRERSSRSGRSRSGRADARRAQAGHSSADDPVDGPSGSQPGRSALRPADQPQTGRGHVSSRARQDTSGGGGGIGEDGGWRRAGSFRWLGAMPTPAGRLDFEHEGEPQREAPSGAERQALGAQAPMRAGNDGSGSAARMRTSIGLDTAVRGSSSRDMRVAPSGAADAGRRAPPPERARSMDSEAEVEIGGFLASLFASPPAPLLPGGPSAAIADLDKEPMSYVQFPATSSSQPSSLTPMPTPSDSTQPRVKADPFARQTLHVEPATGASSGPSHGATGPSSGPSHAVITKDGIEVDTPSIMTSLRGPAARVAAPRQRSESTAEGATEGVGSSATTRESHVGWHAGTTALQLAQEAQAARNAAAAAREAAEIATLAAAAATAAAATQRVADEGGAPPPSAPVAEHRQRQHDAAAGEAGVAPALGREASQQPSPALWQPQQQPQQQHQASPPPQQQQQQRATDGGAFYHAVVWQVPPSGGAVVVPPLSPEATAPQTEPSFSDPAGQAPHASVGLIPVGGYTAATAAAAAVEAITGSRSQMPSHVQFVPAAAFSGWRFPMAQPPLAAVPGTAAPPPIMSFPATVPPAVAPASAGAHYQVPPPAPPSSSADSEDGRVAAIAAAAAAVDAYATSESHGLALPAQRSAPAGGFSGSGSLHLIPARQLPSTYASRPQQAQPREELLPSQDLAARRSRYPAPINVVRSISPPAAGGAAVQFGASPSQRQRAYTSPVSQSRGEHARGYALRHQEMSMLAATGADREDELLRQLLRPGAGNAEGGAGATEAFAEDEALARFRELRQHLASSPPTVRPALAPPSALPLRANQAAERNRGLSMVDAQQLQRPQAAPGGGRGIATESQGVLSQQDSDRERGLARSGAVPVVHAVASEGLPPDECRDYQAFQLVKQRLGLLDGTPPSTAPVKAIAAAAAAAAEAAVATTAARATATPAPASPSPLAPALRVGRQGPGSSSGDADVSGGDGTPSDTDSKELALRLNRLADRTAKLQHRMERLARPSPTQQ